MTRQNPVMRISGGVLALIVALAGSACAPGGPAEPRGDARGAAALPDATAPAPATPGGGADGTASGPPAGAPRPTGSAPAGTVDGPSSVAAAPAAAEQRRRLTARLDRYLRGRPGRASVAVYDRVTGMRYQYREGTPYRLGDVAELDILLVLLLRAQGRPRGLTPAERDLATKMIRLGDDQAAERLYAALGGRAGVARTLRRVGLDRTLPGPGLRWKETRSVVSDQLRVLDLLTAPGGPLNDRNRAFAAALLAVDAPGRHGGVGAATMARDRVALRNGRLRHRDRWTVTSAGRIVSPSRDTLIAVLSDRHPRPATGRATVERVATLVMDEVRRD